MLRQASALLRGCRPLHTTTTIAASSSRAAEAWQAIEHGPQYDIPSMRNRKLKFGLSLFAIVVGGLALPVIAAEWQQEKARG